MPRSVTKSSRDDATYWQARLRSSDFRKRLESVVLDELAALGRLRVREVIDVRQVRRSLRAMPARLFDRDILADLVIDLQRRSIARLEKYPGSLRQVLGERVAREIEASVLPDAEAPAELRQAMENLVRQEFVGAMLTDLVFTSLLAFNERINPLFGVFAMRSLEDQIKSFIRAVLPMLQDRIVTFAFSPRNQKIAENLSRTIVRQLMAGRISAFVASQSPYQRSQAERLARELIHSDKVEALSRTLALSWFDDFYAAAQGRRIGELIDLELHGRVLAKTIVSGVIEVLARNSVTALVAAEVARAHGTKSPPSRSHKAPVERRRSR